MPPKKDKGKGRAVEYPDTTKSQDILPVGTPPEELSDDWDETCG